MGAKILIAEDEFGIRSALSFLLGEEGYDITTVDNGKEAMEAIRSEHFDLLIADIRMPGLTGLQLLQDVVKIPAGPETIIMTAYGNVDTAIDALKTGAKDFLIKPFSNEILKATVSRVLKMRELSEENNKLHELERLKKEFITMIAHELRTPLTAIKGYLKLVISGMAGSVHEQQREFLQVAYQNSERLQEITNRMIDIGCLELNDFSLENISANSLNVIWEAISGVQNNVASKQLILEVNLATILKPIMVDVFRMKQIITFLLDNAIAFSPVGKHIWISVDQWKGTENIKKDMPVSYVNFEDLQEKKEYLEISVQDEGPGIPEEKLSRIFEQFYQVENLYTRQVGGMGVGLSLCKKLVTLMGGKIWVQSKVGEGCRFVFILPWHQAEENSHNHDAEDFGKAARQPTMKVFDSQAA